MTPASVGERPAHAGGLVEGEYSYKTGNKEYKPHLLIGYEGAGGGM